MFDDVVRKRVHLVEEAADAQLGRDERHHRFLVAEAVAESLRQHAFAGAVVPFDEDDGTLGDAAAEFLFETVVPG